MSAKKTRAVERRRIQKRFKRNALVILVGTMVAVLGGRLSSHAETLADAVDVVVTNGVAYLATETNGLVLLGVTNPATPQWLGSFSTASSPAKLCISGGLAFVAEGSAGLQIINVTNPAAPFLAGSFNTTGYAWDVVVRNGLAFVADDSAGLLVLSVTNPSSPALLGSYATNVRAQGLCLSGNLAFIASSAGDILPGTNVAAMVVIDVSDPAHPAEAGRLGIGFRAMDTAGQLVFAATGNSMDIISVTNPAQPAVIGSFQSYYSTNWPPPVGIPAYDVRVGDNLAYVAGYSGDDSRLYVLDVRDPTEPIPVGYYTGSGQSTAVWVQGNFVYLAGYDSPLDIIKTPFDTSPVASPALSASASAGLNLWIHGRHGLHYEVEFTDHLAGANWQTLQTILLTNDTAVISVPLDQAAGFFRVRQLD